MCWMWALLYIFWAESYLFITPKHTSAWQTWLILLFASNIGYSNLNLQYSKLNKEYKHWHNFRHIKREEQKDLWES